MDWASGQRAENRDRRVILLLIQPCAVPTELERLHYHDLSDPTTYTLGLAKLGRDLLHIAAAKPAGRATAQATPRYVVGAAVNSTIGDHGVTINQFDPGALDPVTIARLVQTLRTPAPGDLDEQQAEQTAAIQDALKSHTFPADELGRHLAVIQMALAEINVRAAQIRDRQFAESACQVVEQISAPGLDVKHKLKLSIPIVPLLLAYEAEFELSSRLNLEEAWRSIRGWIAGRS